MAQVGMCVCMGVRACVCVSMGICTKGVSMMCARVYEGIRESEPWVSVSVACACATAPPLDPLAFPWVAAELAHRSPFPLQQLPGASQQPAGLFDSVHP